MDPSSDLQRFRGVHAGETLVVCGCGASLGGLAEPGRFVTIGVNDVGRLFDPTYLVVVNPRNQFKGDRFRWVEESKARALFTQLDLAGVRPPVVRFRLGKYGGTDLRAAGDVLHYAQNSPYVAVCLAAYMGASRIGLIGVDLTDHHFFGATGRHPLAKRLREIDQQYGKLAAALAKGGIELVNLSPVSRLTSLPRIRPDQLDGGTPRSGATPLRIVSYATTPIAGVPPILARCIAARTPHRARCVWAYRSYGNGMEFQGDVEWRRAPREAEGALEEADVVIVHNGKVDSRHRRLIDAKPVVVMAHNYRWNVDAGLVDRGYPGVVVGQYQAALPEFEGWRVVPNPLPLWEAEFQPGPKPAVPTICYTPSGPHERYPAGHRLYWHAKGYATTTAVLDRLAARLGVRVERVRGRQLSHARSLQMKREAHVVIDECVTGSYHRNSLEGLAAGCVVVNGLGLVDGIAGAFRRCAPGAAHVPFVRSTLGGLEETLARLVERGAEALQAEGRASRAWAEEHWEFARQWESFWEPAVHAALERAGKRAPRPAAPSAAARDAGPEAVSVVVPHMGAARLPHLEATLASLRRCRGVGEVVVCELGTAPLARDVAARGADRHVFVRHDGPFERARALNVGIGATTCEVVLWMDNDVLLPEDFVVRAASELRDRRLDHLIPFSRVLYLSEPDTREVMAGARQPAGCRPERVLYTGGRGPNPAGGTLGMARREFLRRYGGFVEGFRGWGGEDNAWHWKAGLLGRTASTVHPDQDVHHLHHPGSGGYPGSRPAEQNPHYAKNVALMRRVFALRNARSFLAAFPPPPHWPCPWAGERRVVFAHSGAGEWTAFARAAARALHESHGVAVDEVRVPPENGAGERCAAAGALVAFGAEAARSLLDAGVPGLAGRLLVVTGAEDGAAALPEPLRACTRVPLAPAGAGAEPERAAVRLLGPLSLALAPAAGPSPVVPRPAEPAAAPAAADTLPASPLPVWLYWEGAYPDWIRACHATIEAHVPCVRLLTRDTFAALRDRDRDIDLDRLHVAHRADFVRAFLLARFGGLWIDSDCLVVRPLDEVLERVREHEFVGHRERSGLISNGFMGARPGSRTAAAVYDRICRTLRARRPRGWTTLGSEPLTQLVPARSWHELPCEAVQPVCWSNPAAFFALGTPAEHEAAVASGAFCYMLSNTEITRYQPSAPHPLEHPDSFFTYLFRRSLAGADVPPAGRQNGDTPVRTPYAAIFRAMSDVHRRYRDESVSGPGSSLAQTRELRAALPVLLAELGVRSLLDAGCGDHNWMKELVLDGVEYVGVDVQRDQVDENRRRHGGSGRRFEAADILGGALPAADLIFCRDCLVHLSHAEVVLALRNFKRSGARWLLTTTFTRPRPNHDTSLGRWRPLNLQLAPFGFPAPLRVIVEGCSEDGGAWPDKSLALWSLDALPV
ncbi:MAG: methyltransferase domain-containing protein [Longimicrobiaceae bacterium]